MDIREEPRETAAFDFEEDSLGFNNFAKFKNDSKMKAMIEEM